MVGQDHFPERRALIESAVASGHWIETWKGRLLGLVLIAGFALTQYSFWEDPERLWNWNRQPSPVLGPLYFLANANPNDDWLGWFLVGLLLPSILMYPVWPNRKTFFILVLALVAWEMPGVLLILRRAP